MTCRAAGERQSSWTPTRCEPGHRDDGDDNDDNGGYGGEIDDDGDILIRRGPKKNPCNNFHGIQEDQIDPLKG